MKAETQETRITNTQYHPKCCIKPRMGVWGESLEATVLARWTTVGSAAFITGEYSCVFRTKGIGGTLRKCISNESHWLADERFHITFPFLGRHSSEDTRLTLRDKLVIYSMDTLSTVRGVGRFCSFSSVQCCCGLTRAD